MLSVCQRVELDFPDMNRRTFTKLLGLAAAALPFGLLSKKPKANPSQPLDGQVITYWPALTLPNFLENRGFGVYYSARVLTTDQVFQVHRYLNAKYGFSLPTS